MVSLCFLAHRRSYAFDLLRWFRFLHDRLIGWERAERVDVRAFIEHLRETPNPQRLRRRPDGPPPGSVNALTGKLELSAKYAARTSNHQLLVTWNLAAAETISLRYDHGLRRCVGHGSAGGEVAGAGPARADGRLASRVGRSRACAPDVGCLRVTPLI